MATYKRKQGDSLWMTGICKQIESIDPVWGNWSGTWNVTAVAGGAVLVSGVLTKHATEKIFYFRSGPANTIGWSALPAGTYLLTIQIDNTTVDYRHEEQAKLVIQAQGLTP